jgi:hypothetical protein
VHGQGVTGAGDRKDQTAPANGKESAATKPNISADTAGEKSDLSHQSNDNRGAISREQMMRWGFGSPRISDYDKDDPLFHEYEFEIPLCRVASRGCTGSNVLRFGDSWSAPSSTPPVRQGRNELWGYPGAGKTNPIFHVSGVDESGNSYFINMTLRGHNYHAGTVYSRTFEKDGTLYLKTHGFGYSSNYYFKIENYAVGYAYFSSWQNSVRRQMQLHTKEYFREGPLP